MNLRRKLLSLALAFALAGAAWATTIVPLTVEQLTRASTQVARVQALESWSEWDADGARIWTFTRFRLLESLKGESSPTLVVRQAGGRVEGYEQRVSGLRSWSPGEQAVLFLKPASPPARHLHVTGLMQGDFRIRRSQQGELVSNGVPQVQAYDGRTGKLATFRGAQMSMAELKRQVREAMQP